jgi:hypothetical protein
MDYLLNRYIRPDICPAKEQDDLIKVGKLGLAMQLTQSTKCKRMILQHTGLFEGAGLHST